MDAGRPGQPTLRAVRGSRDRRLWNSPDNLDVLLRQDRGERIPGTLCRLPFTCPVPSQDFGRGFFPGGTSHGSPHLGWGNSGLPFHRARPASPCCPPEAPRGREPAGLPATPPLLRPCRLQVRLLQPAPARTAPEDASEEEEEGCCCCRCQMAGCLFPVWPNNTETSPPARPSLQLPVPIRVLT